MKSAARNEQPSIPFLDSGFFSGENTNPDLPTRVLQPTPPAVRSTRARAASPSHTAPPPVRSPSSSSRPAAITQVVSELREGKRFLDQYLVERVVGNMGTCVLVKVRHARLGRRFLLKYLSPQASSDPHAVEQFLHATRATMRLRSEHAARTVDAGSLIGGLPYLISEAFPGSELREIVRMRGALGRVEAVDFMLQAAHAVAEAHRHGIVHGSLSPSTLFVTPGADGLPVIKVLEFGSSATLRRSPLSIRLRNWTQGTAMFWESTRLWDTLAYSAPEQLRDSTEPTPAVDVWALGAILYELLVGSSPFRGTSGTALMAAIVADPPHAPGELCPDLPRELEAIVLRCLAKSPAARFESVADLAVALGTFASPEMLPTVNRIARLASYDPAQADWSSSSPAMPPARAKPPSYSFAAYRAGGPRRKVALSVISSVLLALLGASGGVLAGIFVARAIASRDAGSPLSASPPVAVGAGRPTAPVVSPPGTGRQKALR